MPRWARVLPLDDGNQPDSSSSEEEGSEQEGPGSDAEEAEAEQEDAEQTGAADAGQEATEGQAAEPAPGSGKKRYKLQKPSERGAAGLGKELGCHVCGRKGHNAGFVGVRLSLAQQRALTCRCCVLARHCGPQASLLVPEAASRVR